MFETLAAGLAAACAMAITEAPRETDCGALQRKSKNLAAIALNFARGRGNHVRAGATGCGGRRD
jgi:hypothetical protein